MKCSIVMPTWNHAEYLHRTLRSILDQRPPFDTEVIVVDDGSSDGTVGLLSEAASKDGRLKVHLRAKKSDFRNPCSAFNVGLRAAIGEVVVMQSDDVVHAHPKTIEELVATMRPGSFAVAAVRSAIASDRSPLEWGAGNDEPDYVKGYKTHSQWQPIPLFYLAAFFRSDIYRVGGLDERFTLPGYDDNWFIECLTRGHGLRPIWRDDLCACHQRHPRSNRPSPAVSLELYQKLSAEGKFHTANAPWKFA